ncbi:GDP-mannose dehydrogenase [Bradyrhizobium guangdongense]|uniref:nucleotide sugar dehydrogenase n=1 Tax=Bradyrhizobium guangdongense TaxID=1325090 RepID=UPI00112E377C|nr:nucleotide sugar dehydrogenase [Bradyrhizobium guangdongense]TPQ30249.1 GDP-mannose dehydrogenase [Bradyrhizobium guangdongense]
MSKPRVAYAGMTHLGLCSAVAAASKGFSVLGFDPDRDHVQRLSAGKLHVSEEGLDTLLRDNRSRIAFGCDPAELAACDLIYVAPDVPTDDSGRSDLAPLDALLDLVQTHARTDATVVVLSQVPPGYTRAHRKDGRILHYQVETLIFGRAVERATMPERIIVGCPDETGPLPAALRTFLEAFACPVLPMRLESAEFTKISINCQLASNITLANVLAELCTKIGGDWAEVAPALKLDRRIGMYAYLTPGLGIGGGNIERDLATVLKLSAEHGTHAEPIRAIAEDSAFRKDWVLRTLRDELKGIARPRLGVLGLAYKESTSSVKNSPALALIAQVREWPVQAYDPLVSVSVVDHPEISAAASALEAVRDTDAVAIMTPWPEFRSLAAREIAAEMRGRLVLDPYRLLAPVAARAAGLDYRTLGVA